MIHNAGVLRGPHLLPVNVVAPYLLTALIERPHRLVYLTSDMHEGGGAIVDELDWSGHRPTASYSDSKLLLTALRHGPRPAVAQRLQQRGRPRLGADQDGRPRAPDDFRLGHLTQEWLATSDAPEARTSGGYWYHQQRRTPHPAALDPHFQDDLLAALAHFTGAPLA